MQGQVNALALNRWTPASLTAKSRRTDLARGATPNTAGGHLFRFQLTGNRRNIAVDDPRLEDHVADNTAKHDITESESLLIGRDFGILTDIQTSPIGTLYVVSVSNGAVYEITHR